MQKRYQNTIVISVIGLAVVLAVTIFLLERAGSPFMLDPYTCPAGMTHPSGVGGATCQAHVFPSKDQVLKYLENSTFRRSGDDSGYAIRYFDGKKDGEVDGHYREMVLDIENESKPSVVTNYGSWWLQKVMVPIQVNKTIVNMEAQALCTHDKYWEPPRDDNADSDAENFYAYCDIVWDLSGKILYGKPYREGVKWEKVAPNDMFDLSGAVQSYSPDFIIQDGEEPAGTDSVLSPQELSDLIKIKSNEVYIKMYKPKN